MKVITEGNIRLKSCKGCPVVRTSSACGCSGFDGNDKSEVRAFQNWANINKSAGLVVDGINGPLTKAAYGKYGAGWEAAKTTDFKLTPTGGPIDPVTSTPKTPETPASSAPVKLMDKWKALSTTKKALVIGGGSLLFVGLVVIIWKIIPKK